MNRLLLKSCFAVASVAALCACLPAAAEDAVEIIGVATPESAYLSQVRTMLTRQMHLPTGREASLTRPEGSVSVWFVLARDGSMVERGVERSSNSALLDTQARSLVGRASYAALPSQAWAGEATHRFVVTYRFTQPSSRLDADTDSMLALH